MFNHPIFRNKPYYHESNGLLIHGTQVRYINNIPLLARISWYQETSQFETYFTAGVGTVWHEQNLELGLWSLIDDYWQYAVNPEVAIIFPLGQTCLTAKVRYMQGFKTSTAPALSYLGIGVGFAW